MIYQRLIHKPFNPKTQQYLQQLHNMKYKNPKKDKNPSNQPTTAGQVSAQTNSQRFFDACNMSKYPINNINNSLFLSNLQLSEIDSQQRSAILYRRGDLDSSLGLSVVSRSSGARSFYDFFSRQFLHVSPRSEIISNQNLLPSALQITTVSNPYNQSINQNKSQAFMKYFSNLVSQQQSNMLYISKNKQEINKQYQQQNQQNQQQKQREYQNQVDQSRVQEWVRPDGEATGNRTFAIHFDQISDDQDELSCELTNVVNKAKQVQGKQQQQQLPARNWLQLREDVNNKKQKQQNDEKNQAEREEKDQQDDEGKKEPKQEQQQKDKQQNGDNKEDKQEKQKGVNSEEKIQQVLEINKDIKQQAQQQQNLNLEQENQQQNIPKQNKQQESKNQQKTTKPQTCQQQKKIFEKSQQKQEQQEQQPNNSVQTSKLESQVGSNISKITANAAESRLWSQSYIQRLQQHQCEQILGFSLNKTQEDINRSMLKHKQNNQKIQQSQQQHKITHNINNTVNIFKKQPQLQQMPKPAQNNSSQFIIEFNNSNNNKQTKAAEQQWVSDVEEEQEEQQQQESEQKQDLKEYVEQQDDDVEEQQSQNQGQQQEQQQQQQQQQEQAQEQVQRQRVPVLPIQSLLPPQPPQIPLQTLQSQLIGAYTYKTLTPQLIPQLKQTMQTYYPSNYFHVGSRYQILSFIRELSQQVKNVSGSYEQCKGKYEEYVEQVCRGLGVTAAGFRELCEGDLQGLGVQVRLYFTDQVVQQVNNVCSQYYSSNYFHVGPRREMFMWVQKMITLVQKCRNSISQKIRPSNNTQNSNQDNNRNSNSGYNMYNSLGLNGRQYQQQQQEDEQEDEQYNDSNSQQSTDVNNRANTSIQSVLQSYMTSNISQLSTQRSLHINKSLPQSKVETPKTQVTSKYTLQQLKSFACGKFLNNLLTPQLTNSLNQTLASYHSSNYFHVGPRYQMLDFMMKIAKQVKNTETIRSAKLEQSANQTIVKKYIKIGTEVRKYITSSKIQQINTTYNQYYSSTYFHVGARYSILGDVRKLIQLNKIT